VELLYAVHGQSADILATRFVEAGDVHQRTDEPAQRDAQAVPLLFVMSTHFAASVGRAIVRVVKQFVAERATHRDGPPDNVLVGVLARVVLAHAQVRPYTSQDAPESLRPQLRRVETPSNMPDDIESVPCKRAGRCRITAKHAQNMGDAPLLDPFHGNAMQTLQEHADPCKIR